MDFLTYRILFEDILHYVQYLKEPKDPVYDLFWVISVRIFLNLYPVLIE